ncbi:MAG: lauroyl acyltransferase [Fibrobacter sp.]|nr:lauroyl acyltransferase [Fibrobacter sp.]
MKYGSVKLLLRGLLHLPDVYFEKLFEKAYPIYKALHRERAYGRVEKHLRNAARNNPSQALKRITPRSVFRGLYWNAIDSYRGLAGIPAVTSRVVFENPHIIRDALNGNAEKGIAAGPVAAISIHQGSFELLHRSLCHFSNNVHLVTDTLQDGVLRQVIQELRGNPCLTEYSPDESRSLIRNLFKTRGVLAMVFDQGKNTKGNPVKLFGQNSTLFLRLPQLVNQMGAGIVTFRTYTKSNLRGKIVIRFEKYYPPGYDRTKKEAAPTLVESIAREAENWIAEHPEQWSWNYHGNFR